MTTPFPFFAIKILTTVHMFCISTAVENCPLELNSSQSINFKELVSNCRANTICKLLFSILIANKGKGSCILISSFQSTTVSIFEFKERKRRLICCQSGRRMYPSDKLLMMAWVSKRQKRKTKQKKRKVQRTKPPLTRYGFDFE